MAERDCEPSRLVVCSFEVFLLDSLDLFNAVLFLFCFLLCFVVVAAAAAVVVCLFVCLFVFVCGK